MCLYEKASPIFMFGPAFNFFEEIFATTAILQV